MIGATVKIFRNRRTGDLKVQPHARHFGTPQEFGEPTVLKVDVSDDDLIRVILENLPKTDSQKYDFSLAPKYPPEARRRFLKEEQPIIVRQTEGGYEIAPMRKMRNSFGSIEEMTRTVPREEFEKQGGKIIRQLFELMP